MLEKATKVYPNVDDSDWYTYTNYDEEIMNIMPPMGGFFFGDYEIDAGYEYKLRNTIEQLEELIEKHDFDTEPLYYYIWY